MAFLIWALALGLVGGVEAAGFLADRHAAKQVQCQSCHGSSAPVAGAYVESEACLACHGSRAALASKQTALGKRNPHANHLGDIDCTLCHAGHRKSEAYCVNCHKDFTLEMH